MKTEQILESLYEYKGETLALDHMTHIINSNLPSKHRVSNSSIAHLIHKVCKGSDIAVVREKVAGISYYTVHENE